MQDSRQHHRGEIQKSSCACYDTYTLEFANRIFEVLGEEGVPAVYTGIPSPEELCQDKSMKPFIFPGRWYDLSQEAQRSVPLVTHQGYAEQADYILAHPEQVHIRNIMNSLGPCAWVQTAVKGHLERLLASSPQLQDLKFQVQIMDMTGMRFVAASKA